MLSRRNLSIGGLVFLLVFCVCFASVSVARGADQILTRVDEVLKANPLKPGEKAQAIKIAEDDTITVTVQWAAAGVGLPKHIHKTHNETVYIVSGTAQMYVNDKWVEIGAGNLHFNPMGKVHTVKNTGSEPLVLLSIFSPALKEPDRHFVE